MEGNIHQPVVGIWKMTSSLRPLAEKLLLITITKNSNYHIKQKTSKYYFEVSPKFSLEVLQTSFYYNL